MNYPNSFPRMKIFLSHKIDLFGFNSSFYLGLDVDGNFEMMSINDIVNSKKEIISYEINNLLNQLKNEYNGRLPIITDVEQIFKVNCGRTKNSYANKNYPWNFWNRLKRDIGEEESKGIYLTIRNKNDEKTIERVLKVLALKLKEYYEEAILKIRNSNQLERFYKLENVVQQILHKRQLEGIHIHPEKLENLLIKLKTDKDHLIHKLRYKHGLIDLNYRAVRKFLISNGHKISNKDYNYFNLISYLKAAKITSPLCNDIYLTLRIKSDYEKLKQYITEDDNLIHPEFDCIGTITSRMLIRHPYIQQLKKENRIIFKAKDDYTLIYCDYNQFEPGILASLTGDPIMIDLYNREDIYVNFSEYIFGTKDLRDQGKILFLSYLYGMSNKKLVESIDEIIKKKGLKNDSTVKDFFSNFKVLDSYKETEYKKAIDNGFIQTNEALKRNIKKTKKGKGKISETRFVLSQIIQGTASYILKKAIIDVSKDDEIEFLVPMHDAVLYQVPTKSLENKKLYIQKCFKDNFLKICPLIKAEIEFGDFHS